MTLKQIEYFLEVLRKGNISTAADALFVSRSVVSRTLAELESEFGAQLFLRSKSGVVPTESGRVLARLFEEFSSCYGAAKDRILLLKDGGGRPELHIGITPTNASRVYQLYFDAFRQQYPEIQIFADEYSANDAWRLLENGTVDAFFTPARPSAQGIISCLDLYETQIVLGISSDSPLSRKPLLGISDILDLPLGYLNAPMPVESVLDACFRSFGKTPHVVLRTSDQMLLQRLTLRGIIYTILPSDLISSWTGVVGIPLDFFPSSIHHLAWNRALPHNHAFTSFLAFMKEFLAQQGLRSPFMSCPDAKSSGFLHSL